MYRTLKNRLRN